MLTTAAATASASHVGCAWIANAALPATCGVAMEVPEMKVPWLPVPIAVDSTLTPGALMSGLSTPSPMRGPPELNDAKRRGRNGRELGTQTRERLSFHIVD